MAIYELKARDGSVSIIVRAKCLVCARQVAVEFSKNEVMLWRDPELSSIQVIYKPERYGIESIGKRAIIRRTEHE